MSGLTRRTVLPAALAAIVVAKAEVRAQTAPPPPAGPFTLPALPYPVGKNEPSIDAETMQLHHDRHHAAYVANLNQAAAQGGDWSGRPLPEILGRLDAVPEAVRTLVRNNGGGHANHTMFWQIMGGSGGAPSGELAEAVTRDLGSLQKLQADFEGAGTRIFGSGWVFVTVSKEGRLALTTRSNQDTPLMDGQMVLMGNDVWEHAYYLKYRNRRPDYLKAWWNVVDWEAVAHRYAEAKAGRLTI